MKIDGIDPAKGSPSKPKETNPASGASFSDIFDNAVSKNAPAGSVSKAGIPLPGAGVAFVTPPFLQIGPVSGSMAIGKVESLITDLDMFKSALANSDIPIDRLSTLVSTLIERKDELAVMIGRVPDEELKGVLSEALNLVIDLVNQYHLGYAS